MFYIQIIFQDSDIGVKESIVIIIFASSAAWSAKETYKVDEELQADEAALHHVGCHMGGRVWGKGHQQVCTS